MRRARTWHCGRMRHYGELSKHQEPSLPHQSCPDCIIATRGYDFREGQGMKQAFSRWLRPTLASITFLLSITVFCGVAVAQTLNHGTFFIAAIFTDYVIVAIDSRASSDRAKPNDRHCKIRPLSQTAFFFATGLSYVLDARNNK